MIKNFMEGSSASGFYICKNSVKGVTNNGLSYLNITLQDASGTIEGKKWSVTKEDAEVFKAGNIIYIEGEVIDYKNKLQVKILAGNQVDEEHADLKSLIPASPFSSDELINKLKEFLSSIKNEKLKAILKDIFTKYKDKYITYPAAVSNHHDYLRGLLEHSISMCEIAKDVAKHYNNINYDLLISGCLLHDIGKCEELSGVIGTTYTKEGNLLGHLVIGATIVSNSAKRLNLEGEEITLLEHMILSHHGKLEFGSPVLPATKEAILLSMIDEMDAKMKAIDKTFNDVEPGEFSSRVFALDNRMLYRLKSDKEEK